MASIDDTNVTNSIHSRLSAVEIALDAVHAKVDEKSNSSLLIAGAILLAFVAGLLIRGLV